MSSDSSEVTAAKVYELRTFADLWLLPDADAMERCLKEMCLVIPHARRLAELQNAVACNLMREQGLEPPPGGPIDWKPTEVVRWTDDDGGTSTVNLLVRDGEERRTIGTLSMEHKKRRKGSRR